MKVLRWPLFIIAVAVFLFAIRFEYYSVFPDQKPVVSASTDKIDPANNGKLVFLQGRISGAGKLEDKDFGVFTDGLMLMRNVEVLRISTTSKGASLENWSRIEGDDLTTTEPLASRDTVAGSLKLGAYTLTPELLRETTHGYWKLLPIDRKKLDSIPGSQDSKYSIDQEGHIWRGEPHHDGSTRIDLVLLPDLGEVSVLAKQNGDKLIFSADDPAAIIPGKRSIAELQGRIRAEQSNFFFSVLTFLVMFSCSDYIVTTLTKAAGKSVGFHTTILKLVLIIIPFVIIHSLPHH